MLYLSLILILSGVFLVIYTIMISVKKEVNPSISPKAAVSSQSQSKELKDMDKNADIEISDDVLSDGHSMSFSEDISKNVDEDLFDDAGTADNEIPGESGTADDDSSAVMYEDSSNIINYESSISIIDSTLSEYRKIKRIGSGDLEIINDGFNFKSGKKLFRFDFNRIASMKSGNNFIVITLNGSGAQRLFLFKKNTILGTRLKQMFNNYQSHVL